MSMAATNCSPGRSDMLKVTPSTIRLSAVALKLKSPGTLGKPLSSSVVETDLEEPMSAGIKGLSEKGCAAVIVQLLSQKI